jgi:hypothetical protein
MGQMMMIVTSLNDVEQRVSWRMRILKYDLGNMEYLD